MSPHEGVWKRQPSYGDMEVGRGRGQLDAWAGRRPQVDPERHVVRGSWADGYQQGWKEVTDLKSYQERTGQPF
jgi:hypothetical protein